MPPVPRPGILDIAPYVGGRSKAADGLAVKLSSNESGIGPSPKAIAAYKAAASDLHRYPDGGHVDLRQALAEQFNLPLDHLVCGAGADEIISLLIRAYAGPGDEVLLTEHGFLMYEISAKTVGATGIKAPEKDLHTDVDALLARVTPRTRLVFVANPNNPTGTYVPVSEIERLHASLPKDVVLVLDAAYAEFVAAPDYAAGAELVAGNENVVMVRTFSKLYGLAALRLGWAYAPAAIIDTLNRVRGPFNVSTPALAAGVAALSDQAFLTEVRRHNDIWRAWLSGRLTQLGLTVIPSVTNFILVRFPDDEGQGAAPCEAFLSEHGIFVRRVASYGLPQYLRISIGSAQDCETVAAGIANFLRGVHG